MAKRFKTRHAVLHELAYNKIKSIPVKTDSQRSAMIRLVSIIYRESVKQKVPPDCYIPLPSNFLKAAIGEHYERYLNPLKDYEVVQSTESYSNLTDKSFCKAFRINPALITEKISEISYKVKIDTGTNSRKDNSDTAKQTKRILRQLKLDVVAAKRAIKNYVKDKEFAKNIRTDKDITEQIGIEVSCTMTLGYDERFYISAQRAIQLANECGFSLIKDKNKYVIANIDEYNDRKGCNIYQSHYYSVTQIQHKKFYVSRNSTNNRLDSNITSFPNYLIKYLTLDGKELISIDLSNSQFLVLSSLIESNHFKEFITPNEYQIINSLIPEYVQISDSNILDSNQPIKYKIRFELIKEVATYMCAKLTGERCGLDAVSYSLPIDLIRFIKLAKSGRFYEYIMKELHLPSRSAAKGLMFEIFFSSHRHHSNMKSLLSELFPSLVKMIDGYKRVYGDNQFAILLQRRESEIFIDRILPRLYEKGYNVLSKHDSILCIPDEIDGVVEEMRAILDETLGIYNLKITDADGNEITRN